MCGTINNLNLNLRGTLGGVHLLHCVCVGVCACLFALICGSLITTHKFHFLFDESGFPCGHLEPGAPIKGTNWQPRLFVLNAHNSKTMTAGRRRTLCVITAHNVDSEVDRINICFDQSAPDALCFCFVHRIASC